MIAKLIALWYQYLLTTKNYTAYLMDNDDKVNRSASFLNANKEGIFSCIGYLAIYVGSQSICFVLAKHLNESDNKKGDKMSFKTSFKCIFTLLLISLFLWVSFEYSRQNVQNVSRRLCNLSFICYTVEYYFCNKFKNFQL
jgi:hypothetical protein